MSKLLVALIAASFATVAGAQAGATTKEKQATVQSVTKAETDSMAAQKEAAAVQKAKSEKHTPRDLQGKKAKQSAVASTTQAAAQADTAQGEAAAVAKAKSEKGTPKVAKPNLRDPSVQKQMEKASTQ